MKTISPKTKTRRKTGGLDNVIVFFFFLQNHVHAIIIIRAIAYGLGRL